MTRPDRGQGAVLVVFVAAALSLALLTATVTMGRHVIDRSRAQTAADAAALSAVQSTRERAAAIAEHHGGELVTFVRGPRKGDVTVVVRVGRSIASAAATDAP